MDYSIFVLPLLAGMLVALCAGLLGTYLVVRRQSLFADTIAHISLLGVVISVLFSIPIMVGTLGIALIGSALLERMRSQLRGLNDSILAVATALSISLSAIIAFSYIRQPLQLTSYLFGSILTVSAQEVVAIALVALIALVILYFFRRKFFVLVFDEDMARIDGTAPWVRYLLVILTASAIALSVFVMGALLTSALVVFPVLSAMSLKKGFTPTQWYAVLFAQASVIIGIFTSFLLNTPAGATIALTSAVIYGFTILRKA